MTITAAADGSALGNPGPAGWCWYVDDEHWRAGGWPRGTNNQGELMAVIDLFETTASLDEDLLVICDSQYVINTVTSWLAGWKRRGWRKADGAPVLNVELMKRLDAAVTGRRYRFEWVKGHAGHPLNEAADERARGAATAYQAGSSEIPEGPGWPGVQRAEPSAPTSAAAIRAAHGPEPTRSVAEAGASRPKAASESVAEAGASRPNAASAGATTHAPHPTLLDLVDEPASAARGVPEVTDEELVAQLERRLADPASDIAHEEIETLLHPDFRSIEAAFPQSSAPKDVRSERIAPDAVLVTYLSTATNEASVSHSALWVRDRGEWLRRFHQSTARG